MNSSNKHFEIVSKIKSGKINDATIRALLNTGIESFTRIEKNLYFRISAQGTGTWVYQYKTHNKPKRMTLGTYGKRPDKLPFSDARDELAKARAIVNQGSDPLAEKKRAKQSIYNTVNDLALDWLDDIASRLEHPKIPVRIYQQEIKPQIGGISLNEITGLDIRSVLKFVKGRKKTTRPTIVNDTLTYLKQLFDHGVTLGLIHHNPAMAFKTKHAGGTEKSRERALSLGELKIVFHTMRKNHAHFSRENYLAVALLVVLGVRKGELIALRWDELLDNNTIWRLTEERSKNNVAIDIPIPKQAGEWLNELKHRSNGSPYVFPSRRKSKRRGYISDDTLNHALTNLFGKKTGKLKSSTGNVLGTAGIEYFVIHDLRRTTRTLMSKNKVRSEVAEKCINHVKKGVEGIYNRDAFFNERKIAHQQLADQLTPLVNI
ncbi:tyrosine-type recombinase/integrase [Aliiglaciecola lipolytica]|uniref:tyrosine-type recombinase/integrase n=1 Tax=Aliiglaciecola lipolytica TaxID=477689 RepID=UPI001C0804AD|nr:site-specific integrase [Aliiglaciecola lipolytica]MBU2877449.1 tyrosine-type recombinase/integrase [Aliiglaciecola lipolytica]